jgi:hypothetical protein
LGSATGAADAEAAPVAEPKAKKLSALDAAAKVLAEAGTAMTCARMITAKATKGYWTSPGGKTPAATLYSAIPRETQTKGDAARFRKTERGKFAHAGWRDSPSTGPPTMPRQRGLFALPGFFPDPRPNVAPWADVGGPTANRATPLLPSLEAFTGPGRLPFRCERPVVE